jgi:transglutaminase-like putative cysteine protease
MDLPLAEYLKPTPAIDCGSWPIKQKAEQIAGGREKIRDKAKSLFYFVRDEIKYDPYVPRYLPEHYRASKILERGRGYCVQKAVLLVALARAAGIPARLGFADIRNYRPFGKLAEIMETNLFVYHGYGDLYIEGKWVKTTPTFDLQLCQEHRIVPVEFDGTRDAMFHSHDQDGELHIEYVCYHGHYPDVPLDEITEARKRIYGAEVAKRLEMADSESSTASG